jgi:hypothetical protein
VLLIQISLVKCWLATGAKFQISWADKLVIAQQPQIIKFSDNAYLQQMLNHQIWLSSWVMR